MIRCSALLNYFTSHDSSQHPFPILRPYFPSSSMPSDEMQVPPMLPLIARDAKFVFCTDLELQQFATNSALVAQLEDALACWLSHIRDIRQERTDLLERLDRMPLLSPALIEPLLKQLELALSFPIHFDRKEVLACLKLLGLVRSAAGRLQRLSTELDEIRGYHEDVTQSLNFVSQVAIFVPENTHWCIRDVADTIPPLFSALRALWVCTPMFGPKSLSRFSAIVAYVVERVTSTVHAKCGNAIDRLIDSPAAATAVKQDLVAAQDAIVVVQEQFYALQSSQTECGVLNRDAGLHLILSDVDDAALFAVLEWQYERIRGILMCVDVLRANPGKIGSALTDPLTNVDLLDERAMGQPYFVKHMSALVSEDAPTADAILNRMAAKADALQAKKGGSSAASAARIPFHLLSSGLIVMLEFNPPVVTFVGGPVSVNCLDTCQFTLPMCCSNTNVQSLTRKTPDVMFLPVPIIKRTAAEDAAAVSNKSSPSNVVMQMVIHDQFCDEAHICHMIATLLDIIESEDAWKMTDSLAESIPSRKTEMHLFHFRKHRSRNRKHRGTSPGNSRSPPGSRSQSPSRSPDENEGPDV